MPAVKRGTTPSPAPGVADRRNLGVIVGYVLFFLVVVAPTAYVPVKALLLLATLTGLGLRAMRTQRLGLHPAVLLRTMVFAAAGLFFVLMGLLRGNPGAMAMAGVFVVWPVVYTALIGGLDERGRLARIIQLLVGATLATEAFIYAFLLNRVGVLPGGPHLSLDFGQYVSTDLREFNTYSVGSLLFLIPFLIGAVLIWPAEGMPVRRGWLWTAGILSVPLVLLSGRRGLWVAVGLAPFMALGLRVWLRRGGRVNLVPIRRLMLSAPVLGALLLVAVRGITGIGTSEVWNTFRQGFDFTTGDAGLGRALQFHALLRGWSESPLIGKGLGAVAPDVIRDQQQPWAYELVYVALLFATGILGVALYAYGMVWIVRQARAMVRAHSEDAPLLLSILLGTAGMLVGNATNPYLAKFDALWTIFLPIAFINHWLLMRDRPQPAGRTA
jgi:hypothetical protein